MEGMKKVNVETGESVKIQAQVVDLAKDDIKNGHTIDIEENVSEIVFNRDGDESFTEIVPEGAKRFAWVDSEIIFYSD